MSSAPAPTASGPTGRRGHAQDLPGPLRRALGWVRRFVGDSRLGALGLVLVLLYVAVAVFADILAPHSPVQSFTDHILEAPSREFPFGTDGNGMDVLSRVIYAARVNLLVAGGAVVSSLAVGVLLGLVAGYVGGWFDLILLRAMDVFQAFPVLILALAVVAAAEQSLVSVVFVIAFVDIPVYTRLIRSETLSIRESNWVESARAAGNPTWRILARHVMPNAFPPVIVQTSVRLAWAVKVTAALAFVGVGIQVPTPEWGSMIRVGSAHISTGEWWASVFPGLAIVGIAMAFNFVSDGLQDFLDPKSARR